MRPETIYAGFQDFVHRNKDHEIELEPYLTALGRWAELDAAAHPAQATSFDSSEPPPASPPGGDQ